ncbi:MAG TPA: hypothetical protein VHE99_09935 [Gammaproteobacteria bacterium]|nr:hypothetical protein [Gammaproteobacteria bacterium]
MIKPLIILAKLFIFCLFLVSPLLALSTPSTPPVNILTWWGYLTSPWVHEMIMNQCHVNISYDEYYTNDEFIRRFREHNTQYDIVIFPNIDYQMFAKQLTKNTSKLFENTKAYEKNVRANYEKQNYAHNVVYFQLNIEGFLWNPKVINLSDTDSISTLFKKAGSNTVVMIDDPMFVYYLLNTNVENIDKMAELKKFENLSKNSKLFLTNELNDIYGRSDFAFAYTWPGIAIYAIDNKYKNYRYLIHPELSLISADLLATMNNNPATVCVANVMAGKEFLSKMQNDALYISPYKDLTSISSPTMKNFVESFFIALPKLRWQNSRVNETDFDSMDQAWKFFKLKFNNRQYTH